MKLTKLNRATVAFLSLFILLASQYVKAQAPAAPIIETNVNTIDSLTLNLLSTIPSHVEKTDNVQYSDPGELFFYEQMNQLGSQIPFDYNSHVSLQIRYMLNYRQESLDRVHQRMSVYFPIYEQVLDRYNLPQALKYVSIIESNLNPEAVSWCGATGLWQFMPYTGRYMGMTINYKIDERKSIETSTEKACEYFRDAYNRFGDWLLAIASYNCGQGNVQKAINRAGGVKNFWAIKSYLPKETQNYVPKFIAAVYTFNFSHCAVNGLSLSREVLVPTVIDKDIETRFIAQYLSIQKDDVLKFNHEYLKKNKIEANTKLFLPYNWSMTFLREKDSIYSLQDKILLAEELAKPIIEKRVSTTYYTVRKGDNISSVARKNGITVSALKKENKLKSNKLTAGKSLKITKVTYVKIKREINLNNMQEEITTEECVDDVNADVPNGGGDTPELLEEEQQEKIGNDQSETAPAYDATAANKK